MVTEKGTLLGWIVTRWKPTVAQFKAFAESYWHKNEKIPTSSINGLDEIMNGVATEEFVSNSIANYGTGVSAIIDEINAKVGIVNKTHAEITAMIANGSLSPNAAYKITDRGDRGIVLRAVGVSQFSPDGVRVMLCPTTYVVGADAYGNSWIGVWHSSKTASFNCLAIWGGSVWRNLTGEIGSSNDNLTLDDTNWQLVSKAEFLNHEYTEILFGCTYSITDDLISRQWDGKGNTISSSGFSNDDCSWTDWNMSGAFYNNQCGAIYNNANQDIAIVGNSCPEGIVGNGLAVSAIMLNASLYINGNNCGEISNNRVRDGILNNSNTGAIQHNICVSITNNGSNIADIAYNDINGSIDANNNSRIFNNRCNGNIQSNTGAFSIEGNCNIGQISDNAVSGNISYNRNGGDISSNSCGAIQDNHNAGHISGNGADVGIIKYNSNSGDIGWNVSATEISYNRNAGIINANACSGEITHNTNGGDILSNTASDITYNGNTKSIHGCQIGEGYISNNRNAGFISVNSSTAYNVYDNFNNGDINGAITADLFDVQANKP